MTLLTTLLDFSDPGQLGLFVDPASVALREGALGEGGILPGHELASTFSFLRPRDLVWNYVTNGYLMGQSPPAFDLLYWNADGTNLPGPMYVWYLRNMYLENRLRSGTLSCLGEPVVLQAVKAPAFVYASREDHIVPWKSAYSSTSLLGGECRFILGASGHIAGVVNPPARHKRSYWSGSLYRGKRKLDADTWLTHSNETSGSWWNAWAHWLNAHRGREIPARRKLGSAVYKPVADAPGEYVKVRI
jgi:polyhydroxyalkanoate synthase